MGDAGMAVVQNRLHPSSGYLEELLGFAAATFDSPSRELMFGASGGALVALRAFETSADARAREVFERGLEVLWSELGFVDGIRTWTQELRQERRVLLGAVHGFAGNVYPALSGLELLPEQSARDWIALVEGTLAITAIVDGDVANWPQQVANSAVESAGWDGHDYGLPLLQVCHGAPGIVLCVGAAPLGRSEDIDRLLEQGAELVWRAGPLRKGHGLCHGTAGNGYAFLRMFERTQDERWLTRARGFAMHAVTQSEALRGQDGTARPSLWTGDLGLAVFLWDCLQARCRFPTLDVH